MPPCRRDSKMVSEKSQPLIKKEPISPTLAPQLLTPPSLAINVKPEPLYLKSETEDYPTVVRASKRKRPATPDDIDDEPISPVVLSKKARAATILVTIAPKPPTSLVSLKREVEPASILVKIAPKTPTPTRAEHEAAAKRARQEADHDAALRAALLRPRDTPTQWKTNWNNWVLRNKRRNPDSLDASQTTCINVSKSIKYFGLRKEDLECLAFESRPNPKDSSFTPMRLYDYNEVVRLACRKLSIQAGVPQCDERALIAHGKALLEKKKGFNSSWISNPFIVWTWD
ncbi:hypothetical protein BKA58DRAFT_384105 [Alternaria rosae]|uniref:uncharacterized protein n=1 Tax=Alternaria rosae TaxID=1187941 RepID=UPI001E8CFEEB|nr:uncharacterized protein BKA58DRAFT_384105 [Alternaria rosae]KAH6869941.1 hypothetical protein BKA58DRAFT_384105 [Alternaria rosae]